LNVWHELGLAPGSSLREIKLAYARRLKQIHPEDDAEGFQRLRQAYEIALLLAQGQFIDLTREAPEPPAPPSPPAAPVPPPPEFASPRPAQAAAELFELLLRTTETGRRATLEWQLRQEDWAGLDFNVALQAAVLQGLLQRFEALHSLVGLFAARYGWEDPEDPRSRQPGALALVARHSARRRRGLIEQGLYKDRRRKRAFALLVAPPRPWTFRRFALWGPNLRSMRVLLQHLAEDDVQVWRFEVNRDAARWWLEYLKKERYTADRWLQSLVLGLLFGPLSLVVCAALCHWLTGYDVLARRASGLSLLLSSIFGLLLYELGRHWLGRLRARP